MGSTIIKIITREFLTMLPDKQVRLNEDEKASHIHAKVIAF
jgi:hypothetical protein